MERYKWKYGLYHHRLGIWNVKICSALAFHFFIFHWNSMLACQVKATACRTSWTGNLPALWADFLQQRTQIFHPIWLSLVVQCWMERKCDRVEGFTGEVIEHFNCYHTTSMKSKILTQTLQLTTFSFPKSLNFLSWFRHLTDFSFLFPALLKNIPVYLFLPFTISLSVHARASVTVHPMGGCTAS